MIKDYDEFKLLLDCYEVLDKFTRTSTCLNSASRTELPNCTIRYFKTSS
jgi:hypothetical protein